MMMNMGFREIFRNVDKHSIELGMSIDEVEDMLTGFTKNIKIQKCIQSFYTY